ncbi:hypothetical protein ACFV2N_43695 [Streptomyces sp. NPDC059680]|uniref:hypothetical protein n=1 Tax=Streptomyces sp. NPDC059680 TaxID=3346904 RepID=UPI0036984618
MNLDSDMLWRRCAHLGRVLLPLVDQDPGRQADRHENLRTGGIDRAVGEQLIEILAALAAHAAAIDASVKFDALSLKEVAKAAADKRIFELLAGLPDTFTDVRDEQAVSLFRLAAYDGRQASRWLSWLSMEVRHALIVLAERSATPPATCGDAFRWAAAANLPQ